MKRLIAIAVLLSGVMAGACGCAYFVPPVDAPSDSETLKNSESAESFQQYADGVYRGFYKYGDEEELSVQFELENDIFQRLTFRSLKYKDGDYLASDATDLQKQVAGQYTQAGKYLIGKNVDAVSDLAESKSIVSDMDAVTGATLNTDKLERAVEDGLQRNVFRPARSEAVSFPDDLKDGIYRGAYDDGGVEQIAVEVKIKDRKFVSVKYKALNYGGLDYLKEEESSAAREIADQYKEAAAYLEGKSVQALTELYEPPAVIEDKDAVTGPTLRTNKLISAICRALADGPEDR
ncbi:hypothetical protein NE619_06360 [Anaerovorax odorimutans]|uniref:FMN-binding protein n=1 Tax=Anaerovorax odorimutans TaxID=109327 RepID=A0ABT1RME7_9FIRM|nr:hypothetical protein [Anaerovorax odorimutans]MCQ4636345.1 hypothetical protein [Anaerovorax odorimutans]